MHLFTNTKFLLLYLNCRTVRGHKHSQMAIPQKCCKITTLYISKSVYVPAD